MVKEEINVKDRSEICSRKESFFKRWNVLEVDDPNKIKLRCLSVIAKIVNSIKNNDTFDDIFGKTPSFLNEFCADISMILGIKNRANAFDTFQHNELYDYINGLEMTNSDEYTIFMYFLENVLNYDYKSKTDVDELVFNIAEVLNISKANVKIINSNGKYEIYPCHIEVLDDALIFDNLMWLKDYEKTKEHFSKAIKMNRKEENYRNIIDELRLSFEFLLKNLFNNNKSLENQKSILGSYFKKNNVSTSISNMYIKLVDLYTIYNNDNAKHGDEVNYIEIDYLIYLTGSFIRFISLIEESKLEI